MPRYSGFDLDRRVSAGPRQTSKIKMLLCHRNDGADFAVRAALPRRNNHADCHRLIHVGKESGKAKLFGIVLNLTRGTEKSAKNWKI